MHIRLITILLTFAMMSVSNASDGERIGFFKAPAVADFSNALPIQFWPVECDTYNENEPSGVFYRCYEHQWQCDDELFFQFTDPGVVVESRFLSIRVAGGAEITSIPFIGSAISGGKIVYNTSFTPFAFCNQTLQFVVTNGIIDIYKSDPHKFRATVPDSILITYYHHRNAFGLVYDEDSSPSARFNLRIPARFYHQRTPKEQTDIVLSRQIVTTSTTMFKQRYLETDYMPYYMHEKIELALQHQFVEIINKRWRQREPYEIQEGNMKSPVKMAKCYLNEEAYVQRSVL